MKFNRTRLTTILLICIFGGVLTLVLAWGYSVYQDVFQLRQIAREAKALQSNGISADDLPKVCGLAFRAAPVVEQLQSDLSPLLTAARGLEKSPNIGSYLVQARIALDYLDNLSHAGVTLCRAGLPLWQELSQGDIYVALSPGFADRVSASIPELLQAKSWLDQASKNAGMIDSVLIPTEYQDDFKRLNAGIPLALEALNAVPEIPAILELIVDARTIQEHGLDTNTLMQVNNLAVRAGQVTGDLKREIEPIAPLLRELDPASQAGQYIGQADLLIDYLDCLSHAGASFSHAALPLLAEDTTEDRGAQPAWFRMLVSSQSEIAEAQDWIRKAVEARARIDAHRLPLPFQSRLPVADRFLDLAPSALALLQSVPGVAGVDKPQTYLILVQNRDELRATGGYISAFGMLQVDNGNIELLKVESSDSNYMSEERQAPEPLRYIMDAYYLVPRDANWSPDFPTAAREVQEMYALSAEDTPTDGAIAFDQGFLISLLEFFGPLALPDGTTVDAGNIQAFMVQYKEAAYNEGQSGKRKDFMAVMAPALIDRVRSIRQPQRQVELAKLLYHQVQQGHLQIFFNDSQAQQNLQSLGLDGAVRPGDSDFLMLVDSNVGFSKVDAFIDRSLEYEVNLNDPQNPLATIHMKYKHTQAGTEPCHQGVADEQDPSSHHYYFSRCYWDYWRLLTVSGTNLESAQFDPIPPSYFDDNLGWKKTVEFSTGENGTQMLSGLVVVPQAQVKDVVLYTRLPARVLASQDENKLVYRLRIQKQAGIDSLPVEVRITGPRGYFLPSLPVGWSYDRVQNLAIWKGDIPDFQDISLEFMQSAD
jgi:hypothetical protein